MALLKRFGPGSPQESGQPHQPAQPPVPAAPPQPKQAPEQPFVPPPGFIVAGGTSAGEPAPVQPAPQQPVAPQPGAPGQSQIPASGQGAVNSAFPGPVSPPPPLAPQQVVLPLQIDPTSPDLRQLKWRLTERIIAELGSDFVPIRTPKNTELVRQRVTAHLHTLRVQLPVAEQETFYTQMVDEVIGFGPLEPFLADDTITELMITGPAMTYVERKGKLTEIQMEFENDEHVMRVIHNILKPIGRFVERKWPMVDARLPDGSRVNAIIPPSALKGPTLTIRKFSKKPYTVQDLINFGSMTKETGEFLRACVLAHLNIVVSGGTGSGKTTLLNVLSSMIPEGERIVTIEDSAELQLNQRHVVTLEGKPPEPDGTGRVTIRDLVINALRMRPERIVVGECRGGEALDMLQAMNTGHDGSLTTAHANTPRELLSRLETMCMMSGMNLPVITIRQQIAAAVNLIVQQARLRDGTRKITYVTEVQGMEGDTITMQDVFKFREEGLDANGKVLGSLEPCGIRPKFIEKFEMIGIKLGSEIFMPPKKTLPSRGGW